MTTVLRSWVFRTTFLKAGGFTSWLVSSKATVKYCLGIICFKKITYYSDRFYILWNFKSLFRRRRISHISLGVVNNYRLHTTIAENPPAKRQDKVCPFLFSLFFFSSLKYATINA